MYTITDRLRIAQITREQAMKGGYNESNIDGNCLQRTCATGIECKLCQNNAYCSKYKPL